MQAEGPRALVIDDDPVVRAFLCAAIGAACSAFVEADSAAQARSICETQCFELAFVDLRLPDGDGTQLRAALSTAATAWIALSADLDARAQQELLRSGFAAAWRKPLLLDDLHAGLQRLGWKLGAPPAGPAARGDGSAIAILDDRIGLRTSGSLATLRALRRLLGVELARELPKLRIASAATDGAALDAILHRWTSSAGFCGAVRLQAQVDQWREELRSDTGDRGCRLAAIERSVEETLQAIADQPAAD